MRILCDADSYAFGPIGKLLAIIPFFPEECTFSLLASGTSFDLAGKSGIQDITPCNTRTWSKLREMKSLFLKADLFLNVMNPVSARYAQSIGVPCAVIDSLFWMINKAINSYLKVDVYYIQNFMVTETQVKKSLPSNHVFVGPIVDNRFVNQTKTNQLLINLGGMQSRLIHPGKNSHYSNVMGTILSSVLKSHSFEKVLVTGNLDSIQTGIDNWHIPKAVYTTLSHNDFLVELSKSSLIITSPGLTTTYEAFTYNVPVFFLPPQNLSQFLILNYLRKNNAAPFSIHWLDYYPDVNVSITIFGLNKVLSCISKFQNDLNSQKKAIAYFVYALFENNLRSLHLENQQNFINKIGTNGAITIAKDLIKRFDR